MIKLGSAKETKDYVDWAKIIMKKGKQYLENKK